MKSNLLKMQHSSLQFSDDKFKQRADIADLFAKGQDYPIKTGTEAGLDVAGKNFNRQFLEEMSDQYDHLFHFARSNWIAVDRAIAVRGSFDRGQVFVLDNDELVGRMQDRVMATLKFEHKDPEIGVINIGAAHYPTKGARPGDPNYKANVLYADKIAEWMKEVGAHKDLAFANGDFNMPDQSLDWSFDHNFTSMADELKAWQNTGHGPIDGFCSYDKDKRVKAKKFTVLDDKEFFQFSDHFVCRGVWEIGQIPG